MKQLARLVVPFFALATLLASTTARAQTPAADSTAPAPRRADWLSDRLPIRVGDLVTVMVDEQTAARERVSRVATGNRGMRAELRANMSAEQQGGTIDAGLNSDSRDIGESARQGDLTAVLTCRITAITATGDVKIEGAKKVNVDGRLQDIALTGVVRTQDVSRDRTVLSSRIADAVITYKGKKIGPRTGIAGKLLGMLWP